MKKTIFLLIPFLFFVACSSSSLEEEPEQEARTFQKDYSVLDASDEIIPFWIRNPQRWAEKYDKKDYNSYRYFTFDTDPKVSRGIACQLAKAKAASSVAGEITQFIKESFGHSTQGDPVASDSGLEEYVENTLAQEIQSFVVGAQIHRTYWEKRNFKQDLGAPEDKVAYICAVLVKMNKKNVARAIDRAQKLLEKNSNVKSKVKVKSALKDAAAKFNSLQTSVDEDDAVEN